MKLDDEAMGWLDAAVAWWLRELGPIGETLVLPIDEHFRDPAVGALLRATAVFAGMSDWNLELVENTIVMDAAEDLPDTGPFPVWYDRNDDALGQVASFSRDLSHYRLFNAENAPADGDERDAYVDVGVVMMGFGVFLANCSARLKFDVASAHGWRSSALGVLDEPSIAYLLALYVEIRGTGEQLALAHLGTGQKSAFRAMLEQVRRRSVVERLRTIAPAQHDDGPYR